MNNLIRVLEMISISIKFVLMLLFFTGALFVGCSDNSSGTEFGDNDLGEVTFTISGDTEGESTGAAFFNYQPGESGDETAFELIFMDGFGGPQTYAFYISRYRTEPFSIPTPGTYEIDGRPFNFTAGYEYTSGTFTGTDRYTDQYCEEAIEQGGELVISSSSSSQVSGSFRFLVAGFDDLNDCNLLGYVELSGNFRAVPYENSFL